ncbi:MAG TPA: DNA-3-methyladenine glycosylase [Candidatus Limnocylindrales bacterium]|nr:DNA-3-methyladenine glycosylase [Candidatus Limnocylindrales bacterium]
MTRDNLAFLEQPAAVVACELLGWELILETEQRLLRGRIVETEAYDQSDAASHSYKGRTPRTDIMFGPAGFLYVYFTYGMHYCANVVTGPEGEGSAVLIRALEPLEGQDIMTQNRKGRGGRDLTNGPAKWCQAYGIERTWNGHDLQKSPLTLVHDAAEEPFEIVQTTRIGISEAKDVPWRFYISGNTYVSKL